MIHEIFGLSDWAQEMADELAGAGYIVVEPDLLSGLGPTVQPRPHLRRARRWIMTTWDRAAGCGVRGG